MNNILTITVNPCIDKTIWVTELVPEKKLRTVNSEVEPGGGGINVARALNYLGAEASAMYFYGSYSGLAFNELMEVEGIHTLPIKIAGETRTNILAIDNTTNLEYRFGMDGPIITENELESMLLAIKQLPAYSYILISGSLPSHVPVNFYEQIAVVANEKNAKLVVDTSGKALQQIVNQPVYLLKPNIGELAVLCGVASIQKEEVVTYAKQFLQNHNCTALAVSMGKDGAYLITNEEVYFQSSPKVNVKSTVGAGDCMVAGMVLALSNNKTWSEVLKMGVACGSAATMYSGYGLCKKEDVNQILQQL